MKAKDTKGRFSCLADTIRTAAANISGNRLRSALTVAIVTLGITCLVGSQTAVDCLASLLQSAFGTSAERISITAAHSRSRSGAGKEKSISYLEATRFVSEFGGGKNAVYTYVPPLTRVRYPGGELGPQTTVLAFEGDYLACNGLAVGSGRAPGEGECLVGKKAAAGIAGQGGDAVGHNLNIGGKSFRVAGVIKEQSSLLGVITDNTVFVPLRSALGSLVGEQSSYSVDLIAPPGESGAAARAAALMRRVRHLKPDDKDDFEIVEGSAAVREIDRLGGSLKTIALIIGILTLCGAAVALANIMLICVAERTREVGIRRAVGATRSDIRAGFICEALLICEAGCLAGTLLGILCGNILGAVLHSGFSIPWSWILLSQAISLATGIAACALPARRAARIDVVDALRCQ